MVGAMADITIVKGETPAGDRTWMTMPDGSTRRVAVHVIHDLPHLVVESLFGLDDGLWGVLARGGFAAANKASACRDRGGPSWSPTRSSIRSLPIPGRRTGWPRRPPTR